MVFAQVKAIARFPPGALSQNPMLAIVSAFEQVQPLNVRKFLSKVLARFITDASCVIYILRLCSYAFYILKIYLILLLLCI